MTICPKQCISMVADEEGFVYPKVDMSCCIGCHLCEKVCPVLHQAEPSRPLKVYASMNKNLDIRLKSSSGGLFTLLAESVIRKGGVVFGAKFDEDWNVVHSFTETIGGLAAFRGAKYVQSRMGNAYREAKRFLDEKSRMPERSKPPPALPAASFAQSSCAVYCLPCFPPFGFARDTRRNAYFCGFSVSGAEAPGTNHCR